MFNPRITLDQWRAFHAVVRYGGYAQASAALNRSQSSVSYNIKQLQEQLGLPLLSIQGRKAALTDHGRHLLQRAEHLLQQAQDLETFAASLQQGWESEIRLVVDSALPDAVLMESLKEFSRLCPNIRVKLDEAVLSGGQEAIDTGKADIAIVGSASDDRLDDELMVLNFVAVAHPQHPLHQLGRPVTENDLKQHTQVVIRDSGSSSGADVGWQDAGNRWSVGSIDKAARSLAAGLGYSWLPEHAIRGYLDKGGLKPLDLHKGQRYRAYLYLVLADNNPGPGTRKLAETISSTSAQYQN